MTVEPRKHFSRVIALLTVFSGLSTHQAFAQESVSEVLSFLVTNQSVITDDFVKDQQAAIATRDTIFRFLQVELATLPISSSTGGFIYRLNPALGTVERASDSFGPFYLERALTTGRGQASIGFSYRHARFDRLDGRELRDGTLVTTANRLANEATPFDVERLTLRLEAATFTLFGSYGITDRFDISAAVPIVDLTLSGERLNVYRGSVFQQATGSASVTGVADVALRGKYSVVQTRDLGVAANVELRLPTGNEEQFVGAGGTAFRASAIASLEGHRIGSHFRAGVATGGVSDEVDFGVAIVVAATPRFSVVGEIFGRRLSELTRIAEVSAPHPQLPNVATTRLLPASIGVNTGLALAGFKWNVAGNWLLNANVLFPLTDNGLSGRPTPTIGLDYTFDRK